MILIEKTQIMGLEPTIRGMRNPMNSWDKSDTTFYDDGEYHDICGNSGPARQTVSQNRGSLRRYHHERKSNQAQGYLR